jgi:hypothetical protein
MALSLTVDGSCPPDERTLDVELHCRVTIENGRVAGVQVHPGYDYRISSDGERFWLEKQSRSGQLGEAKPECTCGSFHGLARAANCPIHGVAHPEAEALPFHLPVAQPARIVKLVARTGTGSA